jgi:primosomal protein N' (replication factor Y)
MYAEILVNLPVEGTFHYHIPAELAGRLRVGHLVRVEFGAQKAQGVIVGFDQHSPVAETKPVEALLDREPVLDERQLALAGWISERYLAPLSACARLMIPPGLSKRSDVLVTLVDPQAEPNSDTQRRLLAQLARRGPLRGRQIARVLPHRNWRSAVYQLEARGVVVREPVLAPPGVRPKHVRTVTLTIPPDQVESTLSSADYGPKQAAVLRELVRIAAEDEAVEPVAISEVYAATGATLDNLRALAEDGLIALGEQEVWRDPLADKHFAPAEPPTLTPDQAAAWEVIAAALEKDAPKPILLHGVTGSGKTELYLRAVERVLETGRQAIVLVPEIALTPQTVRRFAARFPGHLALVHSHLSPGERYDAWRRARAGLVDLVIGPRSALFAPLPNLGLIVLDESHDDSYKQTPPIEAPYYHARDAALELGRLHGGLVIYGSATPDVVTYARAARNEIRLIELPERIMGHRRVVEAQATRFHLAETRYVHLPADPDEAVTIDLPPVRVVDMRQELRAGNRSIFSRALHAAIGQTLERGEQLILFLNRRGTSTYVLCRDCGHVMRCPHCDVPLTWHTDPGDGEAGRLTCHYCGYRSGPPRACPACGGTRIRYFGAGTEMIEREVREQFPTARPLRWDRDTTGGKYAHDKLLERFISGQADVLIGTQMVAKGLDLPLVTLVGVVSADTAIYLPDYRSSERTFQLLTQVAGRAGRGLLGGRVIIQTYNPDHYAVRAAARHDFAAFYADELAYRRQMGYPPFGRLARVLIRAPQAEQARRAAKRLAAALQALIAEQRLDATWLIGPAPCFFERLGGLDRWQVIVRGPDPSALLRAVHLDPAWQVDVDPVSML